MSVAHWLLVGVLCLAVTAAQMAAHRLATEVAELTGLRRLVLTAPEAAIARHCAAPPPPRHPDGTRRGPRPAGRTEAAWLPSFSCRRELLWRHTEGGPVSVCDGGPPEPAATRQLRRYYLALTCAFHWEGRTARLPAVTTSLVR